MWQLKMKMFLLVTLMFAILYGVITAIGALSGTGSALTYLILGFGFLGLQYLIGPSIVGWTMKVKWVSDKEEPGLHRMIEELAREAHLPKPKVGISQLSIPNAFALSYFSVDLRLKSSKNILLSASALCTCSKI